MLLVTPRLAAQIKDPTEAVQITVDWNRVVRISKSTATLQVVVNPLLRRGSPIHDAAFANLKELAADYVRYVPWHPYPQLAVAELRPPSKDSTSWDFSLIDPMTEDFLHATEGHPVILNFSTAPAWLFKTGKPVEYPEKPDQVYWHYTQGSALRDSTNEELAQYYARLVNWYTNGGFVDENGRQHVSGHHYEAPYWEVFNEPDIEHSPTPEQYTARYDAIVSAIRQQNPRMRFVGLALARPEAQAKTFEYFLNHANHRPGIPLDMISYHFYASPRLQETIDDWQYSFFDQADRFLAVIGSIEQIRLRLSPETRTDLDEIGSILPTDWHPDDPYAAGPPIDAAYWNASANLYAYVYLEAVKLGIDVIGESQLVGFPSQFPSVTMLDWNTGKPNARFTVLQLLKKLRPGDSLVATKLIPRHLDAQAFVRGHFRSLLLVNKRNRRVNVVLPIEMEHAEMTYVSMLTGASMRRQILSGQNIRLDPFAVALIETDDRSSPASAHNDDASEVSSVTVPVQGVDVLEVH